MHLIPMLAATAARSTPTWLILGVLALFALGFVTIIGTAQRRQALGRSTGRRSEATALDLTFSVGDPDGLATSPWLFIHQGGTQIVRDTIRGSWNGLQVLAFDFSYTVAARPFPFLCTERPVGQRWPHVVVATWPIEWASTGAHLAKVILESDAFDRKWHVFAETPKAGVDLIDQRMMEWLLAPDRIRGFEILDGRLLAFMSSTAGASLEDGLAWMSGIFEHIPAVFSELYGTV